LLSQAYKRHARQLYEEIHSYKGRGHIHAVQNRENKGVSYIAQNDGGNTTTKIGNNSAL
jgi:hypothetical protein